MQLDFFAENALLFEGALKESEQHEGSAERANDAFNSMQENII